MKIQYRVLMNLLLKTNHNSNNATARFSQIRANMEDSILRARLQLQELREALYNELNKGNP